MSQDSKVGPREEKWTPKVHTCGGWLVHDSDNVQTGDRAGVLGSLSLIVVEIGRDCHDGVHNLPPEVTLRNLFHFPQNHSGNFFRREQSVFSLNLDGDGGFAILV